MVIYYEVMWGVLVSFVSHHVWEGAILHGRLIEDLGVNKVAL